MSSLAPLPSITAHKYDTPQDEFAIYMACEVL